MRILSVEKYLQKIIPYLKDIINDLKKSDTWKIQSTITINFFSSDNDSDEERVMHSTSDNLKIMISNEADEVIKKLFVHLKIDIKIIWNQWEVVSLSSIMFSFCIINVLKSI